MVSDVLRCMLGKEKVVVAGAVEKSPSAAMFLMKNRDCGCIFSDVKLVEEALLKGSGKVPCFAHGQFCELPQPQAREAIYACGCDLEKAAKDGSQETVLDSVTKHIASQKPPFTVLETPASAKAPQILSQALGNIPGCTVATFDCSAHPLPSHQTRLFSYVSFSESADALREEYKQLRKTVHSEMLTHHAQQILSTAIAGRRSGRGHGGSAELVGADKEPSEGAGTVGAEMTDTDKDAAYAAAFGKALQKAVTAKRLDSGDCVPVRSQRPSAKFSSVKGAASWVQAQVDVYSLIVAKLQREHGAEAFFPIGDVYQSADRGTVKIAGDLPGISTSAHWFNFLDGEFVDPLALFGAQGFQTDKLDLTGFSDKEKTSLAGNAMASTSAVLALTPILRALGYLKRCPCGEP